MTFERTCECGADLQGDDEDAFVDAFHVHARADHPDWAQFPDVGVRNYGAALLRLDGPSERLDAIGDVEVHPVTDDRIEDWTRFFDHDGFVGRPEWAACYCTEPHLLSPISETPSEDHRTWKQNRELEREQLRAGRSFGYLAYVDGRVGGWVNASKRSDYALFRLGAPDDDEVIGVSCFVIAPPYRRHASPGSSSTASSPMPPGGERRSSRPIRSSAPPRTAAPTSAARVRCTRRGASRPSRSASATRSCAVPLEELDDGVPRRAVLQEEQVTALEDLEVRARDP